MLVTRLEPDESTAARAWVAEIHRLATGRRVPVRRDVAGDLRDRWLGLARTLYARAQPSPTPRGAAWSATLAVRAADRYLHEHLGSTVYLADVSRATDVPARTLQAAFRDVLDGSPMAYLETLRLHAALRALRTGAADTVRAAALGVGLRHAARFSAAFRARFSAKPGDVLRAAKAARGAKPDPA
jgi:transcriptional regulator GlxA family with amidase domain